MTIKNKNDVPLNDMAILDNEISFEKYEYKNCFSLLCHLMPERDDERIVIIGSDPKITKRGLVYIMVIKGKIYKMGSSSTSFKDRIGSYNCGKEKARRKGTCSTTNYFVLQTLLNFDSLVAVYCVFPTKKNFEFLGVKGEEAFPPAKNMEKIFLIKYREKYKKLPIACTQQ